MSHDDRVGEDELRSSEPIAGGRRNPPRVPDKIDSLSELARQVAADGASDPQQGKPQPGWDAFVVARIADEAARRRRGVWAAAAGTAALAAVIGGVIGGTAWKSGRAASLTFTLEGAAAGAEGYIPRVQNPRALLKFSDGTEVTLQQGSRAWVVSTDAQGARIRLEEGHGHFAVAHRPHARWAVEAGPYTIDVTGTRFDVLWAGGDDLFEVHLVSGAVTVRGPLTGDGIKLRPGQRFRGKLSEAAVGIQQVEGASETPPATAPSTPVGEGAAVSRPARPALAVRENRAASALAGERGAARSTASVGVDWRKLVAGGQFHAVVREAEDFGIDSCLARLPSDRLIALADAARYTARTDLARRVLVGQRQRFGGTAAASDAAFLLGRLAEDTGSPLPNALDWYDRYLIEAPKGSYAAEALGRKMLALTKIPGATSSRAVAREYLERYPNGQYVAQARGILESAR